MNRYTYLREAGFHDVADRLDALEEVAGAARYLHEVLQSDRRESMRDHFDRIEKADATLRAELVELYELTESIE